MNEHKQFTQKKNQLAHLLEKLTAVVSSEALYQDISIYEDDIELEILNFQIKQHLSRQEVQESDIELATDFVTKYINDR
ncbi:hypothetical protein Q4601_12025 [Shewanella sp. 1_MG-2023]|uniref:hypothetical protein n=1 Tax=unclassified Shewanella TaxID=196818 RepID=UPI0026E45202|nr:MULTISPECIES: hypothetical protein [unclassified Shewanella]MDO6610527.1 hypothetical protein [Shewanella sp. 7_MG-2023]MDO6770652.1 hypothetical protein [Shewanella sp. 2_MG-2023]MDO6795038.1 hypothetical protein [Shewanella sp. 1_MG-2023]